MRIGRPATNSYSHSITHHKLSVAPLHSYYSLRWQHVRKKTKRRHHIVNFEIHHRRNSSYYPKRNTRINKTIEAPNVNSKVILLPGCCEWDRWFCCWPIRYFCYSTRWSACFCSYHGRSHSRSGLIAISIADKFGWIKSSLSKLPLKTGLKSSTSV